jgi:hypothetical protein
MNIRRLRAFCLHYYSSTWHKWLLHQQQPLRVAADLYNILSGPAAPPPHYTSWIQVFTEQPMDSEYENIVSIPQPLGCAFYDVLNMVLKWVDHDHEIFRMDPANSRVKQQDILNLDILDLDEQHQRTIASASGEPITTASMVHCIRYEVAIQTLLLTDEVRAQAILQHLDPYVIPDLAQMVLDYLHVPVAKAVQIQLHDRACTSIKQDKREALCGLIDYMACTVCPQPDDKQRFDSFVNLVDDIMTYES